MIFRVFSKALFKCFYNKLKTIDISQESSLNSSGLVILPVLPLLSDLQMLYRDYNKNPKIKINCGKSLDIEEGLFGKMIRVKLGWNFKLQLGRVLDEIGIE